MISNKLKIVTSMLNTIPFYFTFMLDEWEMHLYMIIALSPMTNCQLFFSTKFIFVVVDMQSQ